MLNPSYLIKSRHHIYYFRYPLPVRPEHGKANRVSVSLGTRCPKEALRLGKMLEYHSFNLMRKLDWDQMDHAQVMSIFKSYYSEVLDRMKERIDTDGPLPKQNVQTIERELKDLDELIEKEEDCIDEYMGLIQDGPEDSATHGGLKPILERHNLDFEIGSAEYDKMKTAYKFARRNYWNDLLKYNRQATDYSLIDGQQSGPANQIDQYKPEYQLQNVIDKYVDEIKAKMSEASLDEVKGCLNLLVELLGADCPIGSVDGTKARFVKDTVKETPKHRKKMEATRDLPLLEQIKVKAEGIDPLAPRTVNKYLEYYSGLYKWAQNNKYVTDNPFEKMNVPDKKTGKKDKFDKDEIAQMLAALPAYADDTEAPRKYWGVLMAIYTGARRGEIASLLPDDIKKDKDTGIWYFDITDEEESKSLKTKAGKRIVPVHPDLIKLGFLDFVEQARKEIKKRGKVGKMERRLLYDLTYHKKERWGRQLGRWINENFLPDLELKTKQKTLHSLRHSFITYLHLGKVDAITIKSMVGHEQGTVTFDVYGHFGVEHLEEFKSAIEKLGYYQGKEDN